MEPGIPVASKEGALRIICSAVDLPRIAKASYLPFERAYRFGVFASSRRCMAVLFGETVSASYITVRVRTDHKLHRLMTSAAGPSPPSESWVSGFSRPYSYPP